MCVANGGASPWPAPAARARKSPGKCGPAKAPGAGKKPGESRSGDEGERTFQSSLVSLWKPCCSAPIPATPTAMMIIGGIDSYLRPPAESDTDGTPAERPRKELR